VSERVQAWAAWHPEKGFGQTPHACWDIDDAINDAKCATILDDSPLWKAVRVEIVKLDAASANEGSLKLAEQALARQHVPTETEIQRLADDLVAAGESDAHQSQGGDAREALGRLWRLKMVELLGCPFCGSSRVGMASSIDATDWGVLCSECGSSCSTTCENEEDTIASWNRRATPAQGAVTLANIERVIVDYFEQLGAPPELSRDGSNEWLIDTLDLSEKLDDLSVTALAAAILRGSPPPPSDRNP
jgi:hypothetical protein